MKTYLVTINYASNTTSDRTIHVVAHDRLGAIRAVSALFVDEATDNIEGISARPANLGTTTKAL